MSNLHIKGDGSGVAFELVNNGFELIAGKPSFHKVYSDNDECSSIDALFDKGKLLWKAVPFDAPESHVDPDALGLFKLAKKERKIIGEILYFSDDADPLEVRIVFPVEAYKKFRTLMFEVLSNEMLDYWFNVSVFFRDENTPYSDKKDYTRNPTLEEFKNMKHFKRPIFFLDCDFGVCRKGVDWNYPNNNT